MQHEIMECGPLLNERGELAQRGFARRPLLDYNPENVRVSRFGFWNRLRLKEWDYYGITTHDWFLGTAVSHAGFAGVVFVYFIDFAVGTIEEGLVVTPLGRGCRLPRQSTEGDVAFRGGGVSLHFQREAESRTLRIDWPRLKSGRALHLEANLAHPTGWESIVMATPIGERGFYYNEKINCLAARGELTVGERRFTLEPDSAAGTIDWGRGVWAYRTFWNWASASGRLPNGTPFGLNLGSGFGDLSAATENCFFLDGRLHKIGWVNIRYNPGDYLQPWRFTDEEGRLDLTLHPIYDRIDKTEMGIVASQAHQVFGRYEGRVVTDEGKTVDVRDLTGWAEEVRNRW
ncbi:MAG: DUF2804 domain-containing protein [Candidatus Lernaella stagnicola]|nr:DUF2804 domain-containing protein [Candidatus Lernaella stagnicola]